MKTIAIALLIGIALPISFAACPNGCSGNGKCGRSDRCTCHQNWQGADCSERTCPYSLAWVDTALGDNDAHYYAECGNKGICDRKSGECKCFDGYEGKGCTRSTCPERCSGHGTCEYIEELAKDWQDYVNGPKYDVSGPTDAARKLYTARSGALQYTYDAWDTNKIQGCKCDLGYSGPDCASRMAPRGDDPLTTDQALNMKQTILVGQFGSAANWASGDEFFLVYHDPYGGSWRTGAISVVTVAGDVQTVDNAKVAASAQSALRALPNKVLDGVQVTAHTPSTLKVCERSEDGGQDSTCTYDETNFQSIAGQVALDVQFQSKPGQTGVQYLLEVDYRARNSGGKGYFPVSAGSGSNHQHGGAYEILQATTSSGGATGEDVYSELEVCSGRGSDDGEGQCECFEGFRGVACEYQEALV